MIHTTSWPYANEIGITEKLSCDLLVLGGEVCADYFTIKNHPLPIIKSVAGDSFLFHF